ncbi:hypothetical protein TTHERM_000635749 (macronuclear) [Tetrahymena thermophila SB210]|uniref:Uncharacterized protein n=1 Tax=Tetrahymena thermophila (strain SB210) TaxID=312017 RepID=W7XJS4_TETTS|nr:hypothetical protein TTHERM_000635749 [Tetrahymena thermophila SB210]EWS75901.1 hypothetical protein TTHERM_000635749 [Tetrahymena thermophila SB210]|eukprot:XP_012651572.1 hypothetical protein TTHERM_000635749 [Tetrahymena thermophila SB210]
MFISLNQIQIQTSLDFLFRRITEDLQQKKQANVFQNQNGRSYLQNRIKHTKKFLTHSPSCLKKWWKFCYVRDNECDLQLLWMDIRLRKKTKTSPKL